MPTNYSKIYMNRMLTWNEPGVEDGASGRLTCGGGETGLFPDRSCGWLIEDVTVELDLGSLQLFLINENEEPLFLLPL